MMRNDPLPSSKKEKASIGYRLIHESPEKLATKSAQQGDYRLISLAMGYHASEKDASVFGLKCTAPVETQSIVTGCAPPPVVFFKLVKRYNVALLHESGFPQKDKCEEDKAIDEAITALERKTEEDAEQHAKKAIEQWNEIEKKTRLYNN